MNELTELLASLPVVVVGGLGSALAGACTALGALGAYVVRAPSERTSVIMLGFSAGVMLAATAFSLLLPGIEAAREGGAGEFAAAATMGAGLMLGGSALYLIHRYVPHEHFIKGTEGPASERLARVWLFVIAITLHNFPEGLAVGIGLAGDDPAAGFPLAAGIGVQNIPEGFIVALALIAEGYEHRRAVLIGALTGLAEPVGGVLGAGAIALATELLPWGMAFAAGTMLFVVSGEMIPESHRGGRSVPATFGLLGGFVVMMLLDVALGG